MRKHELMNSTVFNEMIFRTLLVKKFVLVHFKKLNCNAKVMISDPLSLCKYKKEELIDKIVTLQENIKKVENSYINLIADYKNKNIEFDNSGYHITIEGWGGYGKKYDYLLDNDCRLDEYEKNIESERKLESTETYLMTLEDDSKYYNF